MNYNESDPTKRRIPIYLEDTAGDPVTGVVFAAADIRVTKSGDPMANSLGTSAEVGGGLYYYQATQAETVTLSYIMIAATGAGAKKYVFSVDIGNRIDVSNPIAAARRIPIYLENAAGNGVPGLVLAGLSSFSKNGAALVAPAGSFTPLEFGAYSYEATLAEIDAAGFGVMRVLDPLIVDFVYTWDVIATAVGSIVVSNVAPVPPLPVLPQDAIQFDITSPPGFALILPMISLNPFTVPEPVHNSVDFEPLYEQGSTRTVITDGFRYTIRRKGGWYAQPNLIIYAVDVDGGVLIGP
jgi:hypothetical protein